MSERQWWTKDQFGRVAILEREWLTGGIRGFRRIRPRDAMQLYDKLSPHLQVMRSWGCYAPKRAGRNDLADWPLHSWGGPGTFPLCVQWCARSKRRPTFDQFLLVYHLRVVEEEFV